MTPQVVHDYLVSIGARWSGQGCVVELGCWLGATTRALLDGLEQAGFNYAYHAYDRWRATAEEVIKSYKQGLTIVDGQDLTPIFIQNARTPLLKPHKGDLLLSLASYPGDPIEVCLFDAPKREPLFTASMSRLRPHFLPGITVVGLLDYYFYKEFSVGQVGEADEHKAPVRYIETNHSAFEKMAEWPDQSSSVFFRYVG